MTFWTVTQTPRFKAAIGHAGISDWYSFFGQTDIPNLLEFGFGGLPSQSKATYEQLVADRARVEGDDAAADHARRERHCACRSRRPTSTTVCSRSSGKTVEFLRYPREGHGIAGADASPASRRGAGEVVRRVRAQADRPTGERQLKPAERSVNRPGALAFFLRSEFLCVMSDSRGFARLAFCSLVYRVLWFVATALQKTAAARVHLSAASGCNARIFALAANACGPTRRRLLM